MNHQHEVIIGVDTHLDKHVGVVIDGMGKFLDTTTIETNTPGYQKLLVWAESFGIVHRAGVEGTGTYGSGLARFLKEHSIDVFEINRPD